MSRIGRLVLVAGLAICATQALIDIDAARAAPPIALAHVGLVLGLEVSRLARNNADWHRLIELGGLTDTLIGDADGIYHPALFNDRLLLGLNRTVT